MIKNIYYCLNNSYPKSEFGNSISQHYSTFSLDQWRNDKYILKIKV